MNIGMMALRLCLWAALAALILSGAAAAQPLPLLNSQFQQVPFGSANGAAALDGNGRVPTANLPPAGSVSLRDASPNGTATLTGRPFVIIVAGQSNAQSAAGNFGTGINQIVQPNVFAWNNVWDGTVEHPGTGIVPAVFGTAPFAGAALPGTTGTSLNNFGVHFANNLRLSGLISANRPIWIIPGWFPGLSITNWVVTGSASPFFADTKAALDGAAAACVSRGLCNSTTDFKIDVTLWDQGEADCNTCATAYNTFATYLAGWQALVAQFRALPYWQPTTPIIAQELRTWLNGQSRNDVWWYYKTQTDDPLVRVDDSSGLTMLAGAGNTDHFDNVSITAIGLRMFSLWESMSLGNGRPSNGRSTAGVQAPPSLLSYGSTSARTAATPGVDDLRNGTIITAFNTDITLPDPTSLPAGGDVTIYVPNQTSGNTTVTGTTATFISSAPAGLTQSGVATLTLSDTGQTIVLKPLGSFWQIVADSSRLLGGYARGGVLTPIGSPAVYNMTTPQAMASASYEVAAGRVVLPAANTVGRGTVELIADQGAAVTVDAASVGIVDSSGQTKAIGIGLTLQSGHNIILAPLGAQWWVVGGNTNTPSASTNYTPSAGGTTIPIPVKGFTAIQPTAALSSLNLSLPGLPLDGEPLPVFFSQAITSLTFSNGTVTNAPATITAGQMLTLYYNRSTSTFFAKVD